MTPSPSAVPASADEPPDPRAVALLDLVETMATLRGVDGCAWDREQTHQSLLRYLVEETYELVEAIEAGQDEHLREELGDLLLQVVFHSQVAAERGAFDIRAVAAGITAKLRTRHPHVFEAPAAASSQVAHGGDRLSPSEVESQWELLKSAEKGRASALDGIPASLPALQRAQQVLGRGRGLAAPTVSQEGSSPAPATRAELAGSLLALAAQAEERGWDAEQVLRGAVRDLEASLRQAEGRRNR